MGTAKRERQKAGRQARLAQAQAQAAKRKRFRSAALLATLVVALVVVTLVFAAGGDDDDLDVTAPSSTSLPIDDPSATASTAVTVPITIPPAGASIDGETPCPEVDGSSDRTTRFAQPPPTCIDAAKTYRATIATTEGDIVVELADDTSPVTVNNFVVLARYHYYDGVAFHRIVPGFMIQGGDAAGPSPGSGDPGYSIADELPPADGDPLVNYAPGTLAMANSGPDTSGSQFFIMATGSSGLNAAYSTFGRVTSGQDVVDAINELGDPATEAPTAEVLVESITIEES